MDNYDKFIGKLYDILINSDIISYKDNTKDLKEKKVRLEKYLDKLDRVQSKAMSKEEHIDTLKKLYYDKYVIKRENVPNSYFQKIEKEYLDQGYGFISLVNPKTEAEKKLKEEYIDDIIRTQKDSLDSWLNYFLSEDSNYLPMWAKVWAFQGMLGIGNLNKEKDGYGRRSNTAVNPFVSLDSEILGKCVELVKDTFNNKDVTDKEIDKIVASGSFTKLYGKMLANKKQLIVDSDEGIWIKYNNETEEEAEKKLKEGKEPEYLKLYNSLQGYNTGWCTAGSKQTAKEQICGSNYYYGGDFYVYYTKDNNNEYKIPRIAIRMDKNEIGEIRGIAESQNIESNMESILEEKLKEFPDSKTYQKKVQDMKMLTEIYDNYQIRELTKDELIFLYELYDEIVGFGYRRDPRINEIRKKRDKIKDLTIIYNCTEKEIGFTEEDLLKKQLVCYIGNVDITGVYYKLEKHILNLPRYIEGNLFLSKLRSATDLILPEIVTGDLDLRALYTAKYTAKGLILPKTVGKDLNLYSLLSAKNIVMPKNVGGELSLNNLTEADGLILPKNINGALYLFSLKSLINLVLPEYVGGNIYYNNNHYSLEELKILQQEEINKLSIKHNSRGFTTGIYAITFVLVVCIISVVIGLLFIR